MARGVGSNGSLVFDDDDVAGLEFTVGAVG